MTPPDSSDALAPEAGQAYPALRVPSRPKRLALATAGWLCVALAVIGIPLPILPTTPFLLLAAACFVRSSPRAHAKLLAHPRFGPLITQWQSSRTIPAWAKPRAILLVAVTFGISIAMVDVLGLRIMLAVIGGLLIAFLARLRTE